MFLYYYNACEHLRIYLAFCLSYKKESLISPCVVEDEKLTLNFPLFVALILWKSVIYGKILNKII